MLRRVTYEVSLGVTLQAGPMIIASTDSGRPGSFEDNVRILDRMAELLRIAPGR